MYNQLKLTLSLLVLFTYTTSTSQNISIFGNNDTEWNFMTMYCDAVFTSTFLQSKDTLIGTTQYKIIDDFGLIRESNDNDQVWFRAIDSEEEQLIMDLSLELNDIFEINGTEFQVSFVSETDGIKTIEFDYDPVNCGMFEPLRFVEGLGPNLGFEFMLSGIDEDLRLILCHTKDGNTTFYQSEFFDEECKLDGTSTKDLENHRIEVYPNPFDQNIQIVFQESKERSIKLFDFTGQNVHTAKCSDLKIDINTDRLSTGHYILQITESGHTRSKLVEKKPR